MRKWLVAMLVVLAGVAVVWLFARRADEAAWGQRADVESDSPGGPEAARSRAILNAVLNAPLPEPKGALTVKGRVLGPGGPVAGAVVTATLSRSGETLSALTCQCDNQCGRPLLECGCGEAARQMVELVGERRGEAQPVARTTSAEDGTFELTGLEGSVLTVWAERAGVGIGVREGVAPGGEPVDVLVEPGMEIEGTVRDEEDVGIPGALVTALYARHSRFFDVLTGPGGAYRIGPVPRGAYRLVASATGLLPAEGRVGGELGGDEVELRLVAPRRLSGRVLRGEAPAADLNVDLDGEHRKLTARTERDGAFAFAGLRPGSYSLVARTGGGGATESVDLGTDRDDVVLQLAPSALVIGIVRNAPGEPIEGAEVEVWRGASTPQRAKVGADGRFRFELIEAGQHRISAEANGFAASSVLLSLSGGKTETVELVLERAAQVSGLVVEPGGAPIRGARLLASSDFDPSAIGTKAPRPHFAHASSDEAGRFELDGLAPGRYELSISHEEFSNAELRFEAPVSGLRIVLRRGAIVEGEVVDESSAPVKGARVAVRIDGEEKATGTTDEAGRFVLKGLEAGHYRLWASQQLGSRAAFRSTSVEVRVPESGAVSVRIQLRGDRSISGWVREPSGSPVVRATVIARDDLGERSAPARSSTTTAEDGSFVLGHLEEGEVSLQATKSGYVVVPEAPLTVHAGKSGVVLTLAKEGSIAGRVVDANGKPLTRFEVNRREVKHGRGEFSLPVYRDGPVTLLLKADGYASAVVEEVGRLGESRRIGDIALTRGRTVGGRVVEEATAAPITGAWVRVVEPEADGRSSPFGRVLQAAETNDAGSFVLDHVPDGPAELLVAAEGYRWTRRFIAPGESSMTVVLSRGASVSGTVRGADGEPVQGALVRVEGEDESGAAVMPDGTYEVRGLPAGRFEVSVRSVAEGGFSFVPQLVDLPEGGTARVDFIAPRRSATLRLSLSAERGAWREFFPVLIAGEVPTPATFEEWSQATGGIYASEEGAVHVFRGLPVGRYTLFATGTSSKGMGVHRQLVDLVEGEQALSLRLPSTLPAYPPETLPAWDW